MSAYWLDLIPFILLGAGILSVWGSSRFPIWLLFLLAACGVGWYFGRLGPTAIAALGILLFTTFLANNSQWGVPLRILGFVCTLVLALALALHYIPGFSRPSLFSLRLGDSRIPYTLYANFDKGAAGLILLALWVHTQKSGGALASSLGRNVHWILLAAALPMVVAYFFGLKPDFKLGWYTPVFLMVNLLFVCVAEEIFFRQMVQQPLMNRLGGAGMGAFMATLLTAILFALAHFGLLKVFSGDAAAKALGLMFVAGFAYAWIYQITRSVECAIATHFLVNAIHFIGFRYPMQW
jgi:uncharacterized protein